MSLLLGCELKRRVMVFRHRNRSVSEAEDELSAGAVLMGGIEERLTASEDLRANGAGGYAVWRFVEDTSRYVQAVVEPADIVESRKTIRGTHVREEVIGHVRRLLQATRDDDSLTRNRSHPTSALSKRGDSLTNR